MNVRKILGRYGVTDPHVEGSLGRALAGIPGLCDWLNPEFETPGSHEDWHHGSPCPYAEVIPAYLRGEPDPRRRNS